jgi:hypothetical protein
LVSFALPLIAVRLFRPVAVIAPASPFGRGRVDGEGFGDAELSKTIVI